MPNDSTKLESGRVRFININIPSLSTLPISIRYDQALVGKDGEE